MSFELLRRHIARNGVARRVRTHHGDLCDHDVQARVGEGYDLVTGTPPFFPPRTAVARLRCDRREGPLSTR